MPASTDGTDQSKITLRRAKQLVAGWLVISTAPTYQGLASVVEDANDSDTVVIRPLRLQPGGVGSEERTNLRDFLLKTPYTIIT
ncbi:hypothetical protein Pmar_PMAR001715 [Perkinsus marinus ATCC 50983]|uniref:Uncharacterized protein n=1 Tax=Perkinsus marinus (strain ATCC 50983 / TXsc) TaxID=423536 RepID=C5LJ14_PERM5|nr:hypothetical protein Pmar_PMAR001715 [Perkinsus marinus ATCC 50983]EER03278.1 hypothetical protein Pmar_PMAR001715 [Perkinsus marinus ATCC 50983]|eukprot:XP_002771462.1 hypothetical protein Pmar_PMAR001715 [Perkinsus marinus ATCC 50983]